ncbi:MAG: ABC transporter ATP-binding protein [Chloroflexi bacterium]|nr:MAG: ABC transporter ATP-binding protein [Chloroflexota bacterium]
MLRIKDLRVSYGREQVLNGIDLEVKAGECLAVIGESGAGKTTLGLSIMRLVEGTSHGHIFLNGLDLLSLPEQSMREIRWRQVSMVFQNANSALNPVHTVLDQVMEPIVEHRLASRAEAQRRALQLLANVGLSPDRSSAYPHQLSGGEQQRVLIAMALANNPGLIILDEPVSSLDAASRAEIVALLKQIARDHTFVVVTHDLSTAARLADNIATMYAGRIVELGPAAEVLSRPRHPYTRALLRAYPNMTTVKDLQGIKGKMSRPVAGCAFHPRCTQAIGVCAEKTPPLVSSQGRYLACHRGGIITLLAIRNLSKSFGSFKAVRSVSLDIDAGETLALVGQSGSGKTTLAKTIMGLLQPDEGGVYLEGKRVTSRAKDFYRKVQMVFQNPGESLSHRLSVLELVREPLDVQGIGTREERDQRAKRTLEEVELPASGGFLERYPHQLSGGEMQRVAIARALVLNPSLLIADEPTSFLDPGVQAKILKLLLNLQERRGLSMLFITHDLALARKVSDRMAVMLGGEIIEQGPSNRVVSSPVHPYTRSLVQTASALHSESEVGETVDQPGAEARSGMTIG